MSITPEARTKVQAIINLRGKRTQRDEFLEALGTAAGIFIDMNWLPHERENAVIRLLADMRLITDKQPTQSEDA